MPIQLPETATFPPPAESDPQVVPRIVELQASAGRADSFARNAGFSVARLLLTTVLSLILPAFLTHHLSVQVYSAWVLVLQVSSYVVYFDFGVQTGISKYVAEFTAKNDLDGAGMRASAGLAMMLVTSAAGLLLTGVLTWQAPHLFSTIPPSLYAGFRIGLALVGSSLCFGLVCSICSAIFLGLQRFALPTILSLVNRLLFALAVVVAVWMHTGIAMMGLAVACVNVVTGMLQIVAWKRHASSIRLRLRGLDKAVVRQMVTYCGSLAVWMAGMLCVSGLDVSIVGRYDFARTAFYSIATLPTNFMLSILGAAIAPLMPTTSAMSTHRSPEHMGQMLLRATRYASTLLVLSAIPLLVLGFPVLRLWVGASYAVHTVEFLRILVVAHVIRNLCLPYSSMLVAVESQKVAIAGATAEAVVNLGASLYLVRHIGAIGVAYGTVLGSIVSVSMHFAVSMHFTYGKFAVTRARLFLGGMIKPALALVPSLLLWRHWWFAATPSLPAALWLLWVAGTLTLVWFVSLDHADRARALRMLTRGTRNFDYN